MIITTEETKEDGIKYLNINVSNSEVERNPDRVRLCANVGIEEYVKPKTGYWIRELIRNEKGGCIGAKRICSRCGKDNKHDEYMDYCPNCGARMIESQESEGE